MFSILLQSKYKEDQEAMIITNLLSALTILSLKLTMGLLLSLGLNTLSLYFLLIVTFVSKLIGLEMVQL